MHIKDGLVRLDPIDHENRPPVLIDDGCRTVPVRRPKRRDQFVAAYLSHDEHEAMACLCRRLGLSNSQLLRALIVDQFLSDPENCPDRLVMIRKRLLGLREVGFTHRLPPSSASR